MTARSSTLFTAMSLLAMPLAGLPYQALAAGAPPATMLLAQNSTGRGANTFSDTINGRRLENAPIPTVRTPGVSSADRAGSTNRSANGSGPVDSTPFSGTPDPEFGGGGQADRVDPAVGSTPATPNLDP